MGLSSLLDDVFVQVERRKFWGLFDAIWTQNLGCPKAKHASPNDKTQTSKQHAEKHTAT